MRTLASELFEHKRVHTTLAKAKELRPYSEKIITRAKKALSREQQGKLPEGSSIDVHSRREVYKNIKKKHVLELLFDEIAPAVMDRNGGYTRVVKTGRRRGDGAETALIELVDWNMEQESSFKRKKFNKPSTGKKTQVDNSAPDDNVVTPASMSDTTDSKDNSASEANKVDSAAVSDNPTDTTGITSDAVDTAESSDVDSSEVIDNVTGETEGEVTEVETPEVDSVEPVGTSNESDFKEVIAANDVEEDAPADPTPENNEKNDDGQDEDKQQS
jgi:large subunit ribosomal protein L17